MAAEPAERGLQSVGQRFKHFGPNTSKAVRLDTRRRTRQRRRNGTGAAPAPKPQLSAQQRLSICYLKAVVNRDVRGQFIKLADPVLGAPVVKTGKALLLRCIVLASTGPERA